MSTKLKSCFFAAKIPALLFFAFLFSFLLIGQRVYLVRLGDRITSLNQQLRTIRSRNDGLETEISRLLESRRLETVATENFGLRIAKLDEVVFLSEPDIPDREYIDTWTKIRNAARDTWDAMVIGPLQLDKDHTGGSI